MSTIADLPASALLLTGSGNEWSGSQDSQTREESFTWAVPWADSNAFYNALVGSSATISYSSTISVTRNIPLQHPYNPLMWAVRSSWKGKDASDKPTGVPFGWVVFTVGFGYPGYGVGGTESGTEASGSPPFSKITARASTRTVTDTAHQYTYTTGGNSQYKLKHDIGIRYGGNTFEIQLFALPNIDTWQTTVAPLNGMVNSQPLQLGAFTRAPGTVLLDGYGFDIDYNCVGQAQWTGSVTLRCSSLPWNSYVVGGSVVTLTPLPYGTADLNALYQ